MVDLVTRSVLFGLALAAVAAPGSHAQNYNVTTFHYDNQRTGWNNQEITLNPTTVRSSSFGLLYTVQLDSVVRSQPLLVSNQAIQGRSGNYGVIYVLTNYNSIYAIDSATGKILLRKNFGAPIPGTLLGVPGPTQGALSTPVIDLASRTIYLATYTLDSTQNPTYTLHALDLGSLTDKIAPVTIAASQTLADGSTYNFMPRYSRLRASLLESNGNIYAGFASFADHNPNLTRGWLLGWNASTLTPLAANHLTVSQASSPKNYFLGSIWMTGSGIAADAQGNLFFTTGNSDPSGTTYNGVTNIQESVVKMSADLSTVEDIFTPGGTRYGVAKLDAADSDFGSGGVLLAPPQPGPVPYLAAAAGKSGQMYLLNQQRLGGYTQSSATLGADKVAGDSAIGRCWCAPSYFTDAQGIGHIVSSGGNQMINWQIQTSSCCVTLVDVQSQQIITGQDGGFFTSVSSNGTLAGSYLIWAVSRPINNTPGTVTLYAFDNNGVAYSAPAGVWTHPQDASIVPVVANGRVFVASSQQLTIFGLSATGAAARTVPSKPSAPEDEVEGNVVYGKIVDIDGSIVTLRTRTGRLVKVDAEAAQQAQLSVLLLPGRALFVQGEYEPTGVMHAKSIQRAQDSPALWGADQ